MRRISLAIVALVFAGDSTAHARSKMDGEAVKDLTKAFCSAFNAHDRRPLAHLKGDEIDLVTLGATGLHGKVDFEKYHARLLEGRFHTIRIDLLQVAARFLRPDIAIVHWSWSVAGDKNPDGTARRQRCGLMTMVAERRNNPWLVVASRNDNSFPGSSPELERIASPMPMPNRVGPKPSS